MSSLGSRSGVVSARLRVTLAAVLLAIGALTLIGAPAASARGHAHVHALKRDVHVRGGGPHARNRALREARALLAGVPRARSAIVGGSELPISIEEAPWQVEVLSFIVESEVIVGALECGGSIVSEHRIVTAGHCVYDPRTERLIPAKDIIIVAGSSDFLIKEPEEQERIASEVRVDPHFYYNAAATRSIPDDVAVLEVGTAIATGARAAPIALGTAGAGLPEGTSLDLSGFGEESLNIEPNGKLYALTTALGFSGRCGGEADAVFLCASTATGSLCFGDSGSGLTLPGTPASLVGVADTVEVVEGQACRHGADNGFVNVTAPEIRDFITEPNSEPPLAPRGAFSIAISGNPQAGSTLTCESGNWTGGPTLMYEFIDSGDLQVLQEGASATYALSSADYGRGIYCEVFATNGGGTGIARSGVLHVASPAVHQPTKEPVLTNVTPQENKGQESIAKSSVRAVATKLSVSKGRAIVKLDCAGGNICEGTLTLTTARTVKVKGRRRRETVEIGAAEFSINGGGSATVRLKLSSFARAQLKSDHGHLHASLAILGIETEPTHAFIEAVTVL